MAQQDRVEIQGAALTDCGVAPDGSRVRLGLLDAEGRAAELSLPADCLHALVMTLPALAAEALRRRSRDGSLRLVYPLGEWRLEAAGGCDDLILTLATPDGFSVAFALPPARLEEFADAAARAEPAPASTH